MIVGYTDLRELTPAELALLPDDERNRQFGSDGRRRQFQCGRALVRLLLQEVTGRAAKEHVLLTEQGGKPYCSDGPGFSITHTGHMVAACVVRKGLAGIDIEQIEERRDVSRIVDRFCSPEEASWVARCPDGFYMLWVLKEAFVKAHGQSIYGGLEKLRCTVEPPLIEATAAEGSFRALCLYRQSDAFLGLASTEDSLRDVEFRRWTQGTGELAAGTEFELVATTGCGGG